MATSRLSGRLVGTDSTISSSGAYLREPTDTAATYVRTPPDEPFLADYMEPGTGTVTGITYPESVITLTGERTAPSLGTAYTEKRQAYYDYDEVGNPIYFYWEEGNSNPTYLTGTPSLFYFETPKYQKLSEADLDAYARTSIGRIQFPERYEDYLEELRAQWEPASDQMAGERLEGRPSGTIATDYDNYARTFNTVGEATPLYDAWQDKPWWASWYDAQLWEEYIHNYGSPEAAANAIQQDYYWQFQNYDPHLDPNYVEPIAGERLEGRPSGTIAGEPSDGYVRVPEGYTQTGEPIGGTPSPGGAIAPSGAVTSGEENLPAATRTLLDWWTTMGGTVADFPQDLQDQLNLVINYDVPFPESGTLGGGYPDPVTGEWVPYGGYSEYGGFYDNEGKWHWYGPYGTEYEPMTPGVLAAQGAPASPEYEQWLNNWQNYQRTIHVPDEWRWFLQPSFTPEGQEYIENAVHGGQLLAGTLPQQWPVEEGAFRYVPFTPSEYKEALTPFADWMEAFKATHGGHVADEYWYRKARDWADYYKEGAMASLGLSPEYQPLDPLARLQGQLLGQFNPEFLNEAFTATPPTAPDWINLPDRSFAETIERRLPEDREEVPTQPYQGWRVPGTTPTGLTVDILQDLPESTKTVLNWWTAMGGDLSDFTLYPENYTPTYENYQELPTATRTVLDWWAAMGGDPNDLLANANLPALGYTADQIADLQRSGVVGGTGSVLAGSRLEGRPSGTVAYDLGDYLRIPTEGATVPPEVQEWVDAMMAAQLAEIGGEPGGPRATTITVRGLSPTETEEPPTYAELNPRTPVVSLTSPDVYTQWMERRGEYIPETAETAAQAPAGFGTGWDREFYDILTNQQRNLQTQLGGREAGMGTPGLYGGLLGDINRARGALSQQAQAQFVPQAWQLQQDVQSQTQQLLSSLAQADLEARRVAGTAGRSI